MGDTDAFGRKKGEDSLKDMGWSLDPAATGAVGAPSDASAAVPPTPAATFSSAQASPTTITQPQQPPRPRRKRRSGGGFGWLVLLRFIVPLGVIAAIAVPIATSIHTVKHSLDFPKVTIPQINFPTTPTPTPSSPTPSKPATPSAPPTGLSAGSMLRPAGMRTAIARLRKLGRLTNLRVAPDRVNAELVRGTTMRVTQLSYNGTSFRNDVSNVGGSLTTVKWSKVNAVAPSRMVRGAHRSASRVDYLVFLSFAGTPSWNLYYKDGSHYSADASGRHVQRVG